MEAIDGRYANRSVLRALRLLTELARAGEADLGSLARDTELAPTTAFRLLHTLQSQGFVSCDGLYRVGPRAFEVGSAFLRTVSLWGSASDVAERLADLTGETANVGVRDGRDVLYIAIAHGQSEIGIQSLAGTRHPLHCTALGKVLLADLDRPAVRTLLNGTDLQRHTSRTLVDPEALLAELNRVAEHGFAIDDEERTIGVRCVAAPVRDHSGEVVAALSASGPAFRLTERRFEQTLQHVVDVAAETSAELGFSSPLSDARRTRQTPESPPLRSGRAAQRARA